MKPEFLYGDNTNFFMLEPAYQEYLLRWYTYDNTDLSDPIKPTKANIKKVEAYIAEHMNGLNIFVAKGFAAAKAGQQNDNLSLRNDGAFHSFCVYVARLYWKFGIKNKWFTEETSKDEFFEMCHPLRYNGTYVHV